MILTTRRLLAGTALILVAGACKDDPVKPDGELTEEEAVALIEAATAALNQLADTTAVPIHASPDSLVYACPEGGRVKLVGAFDEQEGDTVRITVDFLVTPTGCVVTGGGMQFTLDPGPALRNLLVVEIIAATFEFNFTGSITGGLDWELDGRMGNCALDLSLNAAPDLSDPDNPGIQGMYTGMLCGHEVEIDAADLLLVSDL